MGFKINYICFLDLYVCSLPQVREVFSYYFFRQILCPFYLSSPSRTPLILLLVCLLFYLQPLKLSSFLLTTFSLFFGSALVISTTLSSRLLIHPSVLAKLLISSNFLFIYNFNFGYCILQLCLVLLCIL